MWTKWLAILTAIVALASVAAAGVAIVIAATELSADRALRRPTGRERRPHGRTGRDPGRFPPS